MHALLRKIAPQNHSQQPHMNQYVFKQTKNKICKAMKYNF